MFDPGTTGSGIGSLYVGKSGSKKWAQSYGRTNNCQKFCIDASRSSSVYQDSSNVKPNSLSLIFLIKY